MAGFRFAEQSGGQHPPTGQHCAEPRGKHSSNCILSEGPRTRANVNIAKAS